MMPTGRPETHVTPSMYPRIQKVKHENNGRGRGEAVLERAIFRTSRLLEFFTQKELTMQIGHPVHLWPVALLKELNDNALDACEAIGVAPRIAVTVGHDFLTVQD